MKKTRRPHTDLPQHIADAICHAWPDGVIDMPADSDDAPFWEVCPRLKAALSHIPGGAVSYAREPRGGPRWGETSNPDHHRAGRFLLSPRVEHAWPSTRTTCAASALPCLPNCTHTFGDDASDAWMRRPSELLSSVG